MKKLRKTALVLASALLLSTTVYQGDVEAKGAAGGAGAAAASSSAARAASTTAATSAARSASMSATRASSMSAARSSMASSRMSAGRLNSAHMMNNQMSRNAYLNQHMLFQNNFLLYMIIINGSASANLQQQRELIKANKQPQETGYTITVNQDGQDRMYVVSKELYNSVEKGSTVVIKNGKVELKED